MAYGVRFLVHGPLACFARPELKVERASYKVPTAAAMRGLIESIYWHPGITWYVDKIHVLSPIKFCPEMHNELDSQQRTTTFLQDVRYVVEAHFESKFDNPGKVLEIFNSRVRRGKHFRQPYLGLRECEAFVEPLEGDEIPKSCYDGTGEDYLGLMVYEIDYEHEGAPSSYLELSMVDGVVDIAKAAAERKLR